MKAGYLPRFFILSRSLTLYFLHSKRCKPGHDSGVVYLHDTTAKCIRTLQGALNQQYDWGSIDNELDYWSGPKENEEEDAPTNNI